MNTARVRRAALLVGVNRYEDPEISDLSCAENDCIELKGLLQHRVGMDPVELLHGPALTSELVLDQAAQITRELSPGDLFLFFFAGHGLEHAGRHLLLCPRARHARLSYMQQTVPVDLLRTETDLPGLNRAFILDACRSDLLSTRSVSGQGMTGEQALRDVVVRTESDVPAAPSVQPGSLALLCSCTEGKQAGEIMRRRQGLFTAAFLEVLKEATRSGTEIAFNDRLEAALADRMSQLATRHGLRVGQRPWIQRSGPPPVMIPGRVTSAEVEAVSTDEGAALDGEGDTPVDNVVDPAATESPATEVRETPPRAEVPTTAAAKMSQYLRPMLGPRGRTAAIHTESGTHETAKGSLALEHLVLDRIEWLSQVHPIQRAARRQTALAGDGGAVTAFLAAEIYLRANEEIAAGASRSAVRRGLEQASHQAAQSIAKQSRKIKPDKLGQRIGRVVNTAVDGDSEIGLVTGTAFDKVGPRSGILLERGTGIDTVVDLVTGIRFDQGFLSPQFVTDTTRSVCVLENAFVVVVEGWIHHQASLRPLLKRLRKGQQSLLVIAPEIGTSALDFLVWRSQEEAKTCAVHIPGHGDQRAALARDIAALTGTQPVPGEQQLKQLKLAALGRARKAVIDDRSTLLVECSGSAEDVGQRLVEIRREYEQSTSDYDREKLQERLVALSSGVAVIRVGENSGESGPASDRKFARFERGLLAARAAMDEGVVTGGGATWLRAGEALRQIKGDGAEQAGLQIVADALREPLRAIVENAGHDADAVIQRLVKERNRMGFDVTDGEFKDLERAGVVDTVKMARGAVESAISTARLLLDREGASS